MAEETLTTHAPEVVTAAAADLSEPDPARRPARIALYVGLAGIALGALVMYLGYNGTATNPVAPAQTPYLISGGMLGLGLMALGGIAVALYVVLQIQADLRAELRAMRESTDRLTETIARQMFAAPLSPIAKATTNGNVYVARGASSYHRADCRLVSRAENVKPLPREEAGRAGLVACRICKP